MKTLVLFSAWVPDDTYNSICWANFYLTLLNEELGDADKIIGINYGTCSTFIEKCEGVKNVLQVVRVDVTSHINSDAAGYQACLRSALPMLHLYDNVLFLHTKGVSKEYDTLEGFRWYFTNKLFDISVAKRCAEISVNGLFAVHCHPPTYRSDYLCFRDRMLELGFQNRLVMLNVTYTIYYVSAPLLIKCMEFLGNDFLVKPVSEKYDRFLFELFFPSVLLSIGADLIILGDHKYNEKLSKYLSYNYDLHHSSEVVNRYWNEFRSESQFDQPIVPMIFGPIDEVSNLTLNYSW